ncbi:PstS family phosphate ABC transporter substrate-binding protein [Caldovatus aquaticus]|uniref:Phosphate-binding protein n=1 Tax=Caldovatus aquaticus TaxID=2865671 RepID=A0ABS7F278_9PROT|nr:PstS family phosphate ABC transporter substrate-binding protein [Caldovatus aquaticus]MBW8268885.1 PstS family phosphate ABC transporter substrate-binding protein [Caldovatus aquaticus]
MRLTTSLFAAVAAATLSGALALRPHPAAAQATIAIDGSSTVFPITEAVAEEFQRTNRNVRVTVGISGTGGGFKKFCRGETQIQDASRPILQAEMEECRRAGIRYVELPIAFDAVTVVVSPRNRFVECLTVAELRRIWEPAAQGRITNWNQVRPGFPDARLSLYGAGADSGTFDYFTEAVVGRAKASRGDYTASEDDNVLVQGVARDPNALGYIPFAYVAAHARDLKTVAIDGGRGCVQPSAETVLNGTYAPLSRPLFLYVNLQALERPEVRRFVEFYLSPAGRDLIREVRYVPLPEQAYEIGLRRVRERIAGTGYGGRAEVAMPIAEVLQHEPRE